MTVDPVGGSSPDPVAAADAWFLAHGLAYFVPEHRARARAALKRRRLAVVLVAVVLLATAAGSLLAWLSATLSVAPATVLTLVVAGAASYALTAAGAAPVVVWALRRALASLLTLLPTMSRALPLLLVFMTFLFVNAEVWEVSSQLDGGFLWITVLLFAFLSVAFLLVRLPEEVDRTDDDVDDALLLRACRGTPLEREAQRLVDDPDADPAALAEVTGFERANLVLALVVVQAVQVLLLALGVLVFFVVFGALIMTEATVANWTGEEALRLMPQERPLVSAQLLQVSTFLAAFGSLYLTVSTVTDEAYRAQFFGSVLAHLERAVGMRAVYRALRAERA